MANEALLDAACASIGALTDSVLKLEAEIARLRRELAGERARNVELRARFGI